MLFDKSECVRCLGDRVVAGPVFRCLILAFVIQGMVVIVRALADFPVLEAKPFVGRNVAKSAAIIPIWTAEDVPLADVARAVTRTPKGLAQRYTSGFQWNVVDENSVSQ